MSNHLQGLMITVHVLVLSCAATAQTPNDEAAATTSFRMIDEFDGQLSLDWKPLRPDPTHYSLSKSAGKLTVTTQFGSMHQRRDRPLTKNVFLVDRPPAQRDGFVVSTCLEGFQPTLTWHQAGLILLDDEDNYMKFVVEFNNRTEHAAGVGPIWNLLREVDGQSSITKTLIEGEVSPKVWLRLTTRGGFHEYATSTDGETFSVHGELPWGDGAPKSIGLMATNGGSETASEIDACFDFFELRSLTAEERNDARFLARQQLVGTWKVTGCEIAGKSFQKAPLSQFVFTEATVVVQEKERQLQSEFSLDVSKEPRQLVLSSFLGQTGRQVQAIYELERDTLKICFALQPETAAPSEFKTADGDSRMLVQLQRLEE
jgi:uncharacterized protein (TIGR03067 family)